MRLIAPLLLVGLFFSMGELFAAPSSPENEKEQDLKIIQAEVKRLEDGINKAKQTEATLASDLTKLDRLLRLQALEIQLSAIEFEKVEDSVHEIEVRVFSLRESIQQRKKKLRYMLSTLPLLEHRSPWVKLTDENRALHEVFRETVSRLLQHHKQEIVSLRTLLDDVENLNAKLQEERERLISHTDELKEKQTILVLNKELKKELLKKTQSERLSRLQTYQAAKAAESELESMLSKLNLAAEIQQKTQSATKTSHSRYGFVAKKGKFITPVVGRVVNFFGKKYDPATSLYTFHKGISIQASPAAPVRAIYSGKVVFSGRLGGYGQLLILDHGDQYYSLVGHLGETLKAEGDSVLEGEIIARSALDQSPVYFEIRQRHIAVNPVPWLNPSVQ